MIPHTNFSENINEYPFLSLLPIYWNGMVSVLSIWEVEKSAVNNGVSSLQINTAMIHSAGG